MITDEKLYGLESPIFNIRLGEIEDMYQTIYLYFLGIKNSKTSSITKKQRNAAESPKWAAYEVLFLALYGYTKKNKFSKAKTYMQWKNCPYKLKTRVLAILGPGGREFFDNEQRKRDNILSEIKEEASSSPTNNPVTVGKNTIVDRISYEFRTDDNEIRSRMQTYINDFDLDSAIDRDILRNLVITQLLIEKAQTSLLANSRTDLSVKELSDQLKNYVTLLGLSKKDRLSLGAERQKGSIAELATVYDETLREYQNVEYDFLIEELNMLLDKYERLDPDGEREISLKAFRTISGGYSLEEALEMTGRKRLGTKKQIKGSTPYT
ncbi:hypothetical protein COV24_03385 [candidate division WWE3 bacterium CG10_big_fil_rev_8_21_14_0_10_32_10]|uniref:Uncharacterized protein n=1 Tax=candidate division WWE3 bacterium CG10_big_fil_rev_8_21_14_0_10_32_10 TaxID=1975090 RepID=A0A2H0RBT3_UNCKA|nr:MAG: hypothetical protein COV24_03385 [candidate division WWE3 bacterium CG10_big_fil_rev_8_21_14_0_10_32_10]